MKHILSRRSLFPLAIALVFLASSCGEDDALTLPVACFSVNELIAVDDDFEFEFGNCSGSGDTYRWDFGDGNTSTEMNPSHTYAERGEYTVTLTVTNTRGVTESTEILQYGRFKVNEFSYSIEQDVSPSEVNTACNGIAYRIDLETTMENMNLCLSSVDDPESNGTCIDASETHYFPAKPALTVAAASQCGTNQDWDYLDFVPEEEDFEVNLLIQSAFTDEVFTTPGGGRIVVSLNAEFITE